jgi:hypothetical protein
MTLRGLCCAPMPLPPALTPDERRAALEKAAAARRIRAEVKEQLKASSLSLNELFARANDDEVLGKLKVVSMLESMPNTGRVKARRLMRELDISESRRVRGLGPNQRRRLLEHFEPAH